MKTRLLKKKREQRRDNIRAVAEHLGNFHGHAGDPLAKVHVDQLKAGLNELPAAERQELSKLLETVQASKTLGGEDGPKPEDPEKRANRRLARFWEVMLAIWWAVVAISLVSAMVYGGFWILKTLVGTAIGVMGEYVPIGFLQILVAIGTLAIGSGLYRMRCRKPMLYGLVEIALGILFAGYVVNHVLGYALKEANSYFTVAGALYIIVRGYDNVYRSLKWGSPLLKLMNRLFFGRAVYRRL